jgi:hypothetical protein
MPSPMMNTAEKRLDKPSRTNSLLGVFRSFKYHRATAFRPTICPDIDVGADNVARRPE